MTDARLRFGHLVGLDLMGAGLTGVVDCSLWPVKASDPGCAVSRHCRYAPLNAGFKESSHHT